MLRVRVVTTKGQSKAVQVVRYHRGSRIIVKHIGSGRSEAELAALMEAAHAFIDEQSQQPVLFPDIAPAPDQALLLHQCEYLGFHYSFLYEALSDIHVSLGYDVVCDGMLLDLVIMRIIEPASKLRSIELLETYFGIRHRRQRYYEAARAWLALKTDIEQQTVRFAKQAYQFNFSLVFYDVTTLYFETFESDELRKPGFSKDNKSQQPQIVVGLMVTQDGFPIGYEVFAGNTFEGHTMLPVIQGFINKHEVKTFTVVADAAMISAANVESLQKAGIHYIVGARLGNVSEPLLNDIDKRLARIDGATIRLKTPNGDLICSFSQQRYKKDKYEMGKQVERATALLGQPSKHTRIKFLKTEDAKARLNEELVKKTEKLLGVKGYYTDLEESAADNGTVIARYHELYKIEQAFRISKNDLQTRPIFHFKEEPIKLHMLMSFMALAVSKHIELQTGGSIRAFLTQCMKITDARLRNKITGKEIRMRAPIPNALARLMDKLKGPH